MHLKISSNPSPEGGSVLVFFVFAALAASIIAGVSLYAVSTINLSHRRTDMIDATQLAEGGAAMGCAEVEKAYTNRATTFAANLSSNTAGAYALDSSLSTPSQMVYQRVITTPFSLPVTVQIWFTNTSTPSAAKVVGTATVGASTQTATVMLQMQFGYGAAILSVDPGTASTKILKDRAAGNVTIWGLKSGGTTIIDGGQAYAILANGRANVDTNYAIVPPKSISMTNYSTANQVPDYTLAGAADQLFDFNRFIAVADLTPNGPSVSKNNHFTNIADFIKVISNAPNSTTFLEGVIVVNVKQADFNTYSQGLTPTLLKSHPINIHGTLVFNFAADVVATDYFMNSATVNINPASLAGLNATNPATFTTGYPPVYVDPLKSPTNIDITTKAFQNFTGDDDLPALMYNNGIFDIHGAANICGVIYTPSFIEIENLTAGNLQYFRGTLICGGGALIDNHWAKATSIVSYDAGALDLLATSSNKGKRVSPIFWQ